MIEEKVKELVSKVESSGLSDSKKIEVYVFVNQTIGSVVWPVLLRYMDKGELKRLADNLVEELTPEAYIGLIKEAIKDGKALAEMTKMMEGVVDSSVKYIDEKVTSQA